MKLQSPQVRQWDKILPEPVTLGGAYRPRDDTDGEQIPHSFLFKKREGQILQIGARP